MEWREVQKAKIELLENTVFHNKHFLDFSFHSIPIRFVSNDFTLIEKLGDYLPDSWKSRSFEKNEKNYVIFHASPPDSSLEFFENESSSDVFYERNDSQNEFAIQRDFVCKYDKNGRIYNCLFESEINDGLHNFFRWMLSPLLLSEQKAMLHCSALINNKDEAFLFLGPSGAGKTTITELGTPRLILSDDMNLIHFAPRNKALLVSPGGVGGLYKPQVALDKAFYVKGMYWLNQSHENKITSLSLMHQTQYMLSSFANLPWENFDKNTQEHVFTCAQTIISLQKLEQLNFTKEKDVWNVVDSF